MNFFGEDEKNIFQTFFEFLIQFFRFIYFLFIKTLIYENNYKISNSITTIAKKNPITRCNIVICCYNFPIHLINNTELCRLPNSSWYQQFYPFLVWPRILIFLLLLIFPVFNFLVLFLSFALYIQYEKALTIYKKNTQLIQNIWENMVYSPYECQEFRRTNMFIQIPVSRFAGHPQQAHLWHRRQENNYQFMIYNDTFHKWYTDFPKFRFLHLFSLFISLLTAAVTYLVIFPEVFFSRSLIYEMSVPALSRLNKSIDLSPQDIYDIGRGNIGDWGINGYSPPKKAGILTYRDPSFGKSPRADLFKETVKRSKESDVHRYSPTHAELSKLYWEKPSGRFFEDKRKTVTDQIIKHSSNIPGPGTYWGEPKGKETSPEKMPGFRLKKEIGFDFLSNTEFLGEESPGVGRYFASEEARSKAFGHVEEKIKGFKYAPLKASVEKMKSLVGPGYIKDLEVHQKKESRHPRSPSYRFNKSVSPDILSAYSRNSKLVPGVGHYKDVHKAFESSVVIKKSTAVNISKSSLSRITEMEAKKKEWVPGPGSYDIMPPFRKKIK